MTTLSNERHVNFVTIIIVVLVGNSRIIFCLQKYRLTLYEYQTVTRSSICTYSSLQCECVGV